MGINQDGSEDSLMIPESIDPIFDKYSKVYTVSVSDLLLALLTRPVSFPVPIKTADGEKDIPAVWLPGQMIPGAVGPSPAKVLFVGNIPTKEETAFEKLLSNRSGQDFVELLTEVGIPAESCYITNAIRFCPPSVFKSVRYPVRWSKLCLPLLEMELNLVKPKLIVLMGSEAIKLALGRNATLDGTRGAEDLTFKGIPVITTVHPIAVSRDLMLLDGFRRDMLRVKEAAFTSGTVTLKSTNEYRLIESADELQGVTDELVRRGKLALGLDCEWGGLDGSDAFNGGKLRTIQFSPQPGEAYTVVLRRCGLHPNFRPNIPTAAAILRKFLTRKDVSLYGHSLRSDIKFLDDSWRPDGCAEMFIPCMDNYLRGMDTLTAYHLLHPQAEGFGLEQLAMKYTNLGRYDLKLSRWLLANGYSPKSEKLRKHGYAFVPDDLLHFNYAFNDVDVVSRVVPILTQELQKVEVLNPYKIFGNEVKTQLDLYREIVHPAESALSEVECTGLYSDRERMEGLVKLFATKREELRKIISDAVGCAEFNVRSHPQVAKLLFGLNRHKVTVPSMNFTPVKTTEKPSRDWNKIPDNERSFVSPAVDDEVLDILLSQAKTDDQRRILDLLGAFRMIDQMCKNFLRPPTIEDGEENYDSGLISCIAADNRTRTRIGELTDTGRLTSSGPNLMNLVKSQEAELVQLFSLDVAKLRNLRGWEGMDVGELKELGLLHLDYYPLRSCYSSPPGYVSISSDWKQAELFALGGRAKDEKLLEILMDSSRDLHSEQAVESFNLPCTSGEVKKLFPAKRVLSKSVIFGVSYGRGANALARQARAIGINTTPKETQQIIDVFFTKFVRVRDFILECHEAVLDPGFVETIYGRRRYFNAYGADNATLAAFRREAQNTPIQGTIGEALRIALKNLQVYRDLHKLHYKIALPVHDAIMLYVPVAQFDEVDIVVNEVLPICMGKGVLLPGLDLQLKIDVEPSIRWEEKISIGEAKRLALESYSQSQG